MNRRTFTSLAATALATPVIAGEPSAGGDDAWPAKDKIRELFRKNSEFFRTHLPEKFSGLPLEIGDESWIGPRIEGEFAFGEQPFLWVTGPKVVGKACGRIQIGKDGSIISAGAMVWKFAVEIIKEAPKLDMAAVIEQSTNGLKKFGWEVPPDLQLTSIMYSQDGTWHVVWNPVYGGVPEVVNGDDLDGLGVTLADNGEELHFFRRRRSQPPARTIPKLTRAEGLLLAAQAAPKIMDVELPNPSLPKTLYPIRLRQCDLCVTVPDWVLQKGAPNPAAAKASRERRLCWRTVFLLYDEKTTEGLSGLPRINETYAFLHVLVDAITGEVIGGKVEGISNDPVSRKDIK